LKPGGDAKSVQNAKRTLRRTFVHAAANEAPYRIDAPVVQANSAMSSIDDGHMLGFAVAPQSETLFQRQD
jgi:hypothetical protein